MKILHLSSSDSVGGAAIAAKRLHTYLLDNSIDSNFLCFKSKNLETCKVVEYGGGYSNAKRMIFNQANKLLSIFDDDKMSGIRSMNMNSTNVSRYINEINPDYLIMHWINGETCSLNDLMKINKSIKIIWWCHDMWPFLGTYHYDLSISKNYFSTLIEKFFFERKLKLVEEMNINFICPSRWLQQISQRVYKNQKSFQVPNLFPKGLVNIHDRKKSREELSLSQSAKIICFMAIGGDGDPRKGGEYLKEIVSNFDGDNILFLVIGSEDSSHYNSSNVKSVGHIKDFETINKYLCASNVFINTSLIDNFPNTLVESILSGTPAISFDVGGICSIINNKNGSLISPGDTRDFITKINQWLNKDADMQEIANSIKPKVQDDGLNLLLEAFHEVAKL